MHSILGLLALRSMTGYDLKKSFDGSVAHFWNADQAQIYRTLTKLSQEDLVTVRVHQQEGRPDRREHHITDAGRAELSAWLRSPLPPEPTREPFLARIFFAGEEDDPDLVRALVAGRRAAAHERLHALRSIPVSGGSLGDRLRHATLRNGIAHVEAELAWLSELEEAL